MNFRHVLVILSIFLSAAVTGQITTFAYTGAVQTYTVPAGVTLIQIESWGAQGGTETGFDGVEGTGGLGGYAIGELTVTPGQVLEVYVGGSGTPFGVGGFNGGGQAGTNYGAAGGGASDVRIAPYALGNRVIVGAGGGGGAFGSFGNPGGDGGGLIGDMGVSGGGFTAGSGGTQVAGGAAGCCYGAASAGLFGAGAGPGDYHNAGGGGGWYGGGSGAGHAGAGGGSSYIAGVAAGSTTPGIRTGNGEVIIEVLCTSMTYTVTDDDICEGEEITLDATSPSGGTVTWDMGVVNGVPFTPVGVGVITYTATSSDPEECELTVDITVNANPTVTVAVDETEICDGETVTFTEGGDADTYTWDPAAVVSGTPYTPASTGTITYTLTGTNDITGCFTEATIDVTMNELPAVTAAVDVDDICLGDEVVFTGGGADTYIWDMGVTDGVGFVPAAIGTVTYTVTGTDAATGCENTASVDVTVNDSPIVTATADDDEVCEGELVTLTGGGAATYTWDLGVIDGVGFVPPVGTTTYTVIGETGSGCEGTATIDITVNPAPAVIAGATAIEICLGEEVTFTGSGADTYVWDMGVTDGVAFTPAAEGTVTYTVTGTALGCEGTASIDVTVVDSPPVTASASDTEICEGETVILTGGGAATYTWDLGVTDGASFAPPVGTTTYTVTGETGAGCEGTATIDIIVNPTPIVTASSTGTEVCLGESFTLSGGGAATYTWDFGAIDGTPIPADAIGSTTYTVTGTTAESCSNTASITIVIIECEPVVPAFSFVSPICVGDCITITDESTGSVASWEWDFGGAAEPATSTDQNPEICVTTAGAYTITLTTTSSSGTVATITNTLTVNDNPVIAAMTDTIVDLGTIASLIAFSPSAGTFSWSPDENIECVDCEETVVYPVETTTYVATITDVNGCTASDSVLILVNIVEGIGVPSAFSPNGDGNNDVLFVKGYALESVSFVVYNRYGEVVFETSDQTIGWDGTFKNKPENPGVFTWVLFYEFENGSTGTKNGNTTLIR